MARLKAREEKQAAVVLADKTLRGALLAEKPRGEQGWLPAKVSRGLSLQMQEKQRNYK